MIRILIRFSLRLVFWTITLLGIISALIWLMNPLLPRVTQYYLERKTGFDVHIEALALDPLTISLKLRDASLLNPEPAFPDADFLTIRQFSMRVDPFKFMLGSTRVIDELFLDIEQLAYVKNEEARSNFHAFAAALESASPQDEPTEEKAASSSWEVSRLTLRIRTLKEMDFSQEPPRIREIPVAIEHEFEGVTDLQSILTPLYRDLAAFNAAETLSILEGILTQKPQSFGTDSVSSSPFEVVQEKVLDGLQDIGGSIQEILKKDSETDTDKQ